MNVLCNYFFRNARDPKGVLGTFVLKFMNGFSHKYIAEWSIPFMQIKDGDSILDIGCGGGGNISRFLERYLKSKVVGIDSSSTSVALAKRINFDEIQRNRCSIFKGEVQNLPFESSFYNVVTAFETVYYWANIEKSFEEVFRVLDADGKFVIVNGADAEGGWTWDRFIEGMYTYTPFELEVYLKNVGFTKVEIFRRDGFHFFCIVAYKN